MIKQVRKNILVAIMVLAPTGVMAAQYEVRTQDGNEQGWSVKTECETQAGANCTSAYFCSNEIWMTDKAFNAVQQRRYDGQQLVIVKDGNPICAVN